MKVNIKGYKGRYTVSTSGEIRSVGKVIFGKDGFSKWYPSKKLKEDKSDKRGYRRIVLSQNGKRKKFSIHRLVAMHFIDNPDGKGFVNHIDNDPTNNDFSNLEWCTHSENMIHAERQGRLFASQSKGGKTRRKI